MWQKELDFFGFGKMKYVTFCVFILFTVEIISVLHSVITNLY